MRQWRERKEESDWLRIYDSVQNACSRCRTRRRMVLWLDQVRIGQVVRSHLQAYIIHSPLITAYPSPIVPMNPTTPFTTLLDALMIEIELLEVALHLTADKQVGRHKFGMRFDRTLPWQRLRPPLVFPSISCLSATTLTVLMQTELTEKLQ